MDSDERAVIEAAVLMAFGLKVEYVLDLDEEKGIFVSVKVVSRKN